MRVSRLALIDFEFHVHLMSDEHIDLILDERWPKNSSLRFYATAFNSAG